MRNVGISAAVAAMMTFWAGGSQAQDVSFVFLGSADDIAGFAEIAADGQGNGADLKVLLFPRDLPPDDRSAVNISIARVRFDCAAHTSSRISLRNYNDIGDLLSEDGAGSPEPIDETDTIDVNAFKLACGLPGAPNKWVFATSTAAMKWWRLQ